LKLYEPPRGQPGEAGGRRDEDEKPKNKKRKKKVRNEGLAGGRQNVLNKYNHHSSSNSHSRTCEAPAVSEVHTLHAFGEHDLVDGTCERESKKGKGLNEE
jgi:hypothetical protein